MLSNSQRNKASYALIAILMIISAWLLWIETHHYTLPESKKLSPIIDTGMLCYTNGFCIDFYNQWECYDSFNHATKAQQFVAMPTREEYIAGFESISMQRLLSETYMQRAQADEETMINDSLDAQSIQSEENAEQCVAHAFDKRDRSTHRSRKTKKTALKTH